MKPDAMLVEPEHIADAHQDVASRGCPEALKQVAEQEPALAAYLQDRLAALAGRLALEGAPTPLVQGVHEEMMTAALTCVQALRRGHYVLWKDMMTGSRLAALDKEFQKRSPDKATRRRRKKDTGPDPDG
jgi:hypothetical protein